MNPIDSKEIEELLQDIILNEKIIDPVLDITVGAQKGDGYNSSLVRVDINGKNKSLKLVLKCAPRDEKLREMIQSRSLFLQEIYFYEEIVPAFAEFTKGAFASVPKCYKIVKEEGKEVIILENLKAHGFSMTDRTVHMDDAHISMVLEEYGKFHAVSFALKDQNLGLFHKLSEGFLDVFSMRTTSMDFYNVFIEAADNFKNLFSKDENADLWNSVVNIKNGIIPFFRRLDEFEKDEGVIVQGDCWCNNMMFKYQDSQKPTELRLLDFQITKVLSPVVDLSYFLYTSASKKALDNLDNYLRIYYNSLCKHIQALGSDPEKCYPFYKLLSDWKLYCHYGFNMALIVLKIMLNQDDEIKDFADASKDDTKPFDIFVRETKDDTILNQRLKDLVLHMYEKGYL